MIPPSMVVKFLTTIVMLCARLPVESVEVFELGGATTTSEAVSSLDAGTQSKFSLDEKVDCLVGAWGAPGDCSAKCGGGLRTYRRAVITPASGDGKACPGLIKASRCNAHVCSTGGPEEAAEKTAQKLKRLKKEQEASKTAYYAKQEKKVLAAQDESKAALTDALEDGRTGLRNGNDERYVKLVNAVSGELKSYHADKEKRADFIGKQVTAKGELFEKSIVESVHGMKQHMHTAKTYEPNPLYQDKSLSSKFKVEAAKEITHKQKLIRRAKKEKVMKKAFMEPELGEGNSFVQDTGQQVGLNEDFASIHCTACFKNCETIKCEQWCHRTFCKNVPGHPEEYLESWPGVTLGSSSAQLGDESDPDLVTPTQHEKDEKVTSKEVFDKSHARDPDAVTLKQHNEDKKKTEEKLKARQAEEEKQIKRYRQKRIDRKVEADAEKRVKANQKIEKEAEKEMARKAKAAQEEQTAKDALDDKLIAMDIERDHAKELVKNQNRTVDSMTPKEEDLERLQIEEDAARGEVAKQRNQMEKVVKLTKVKKKVDADTILAQARVKRLKLTQKLLLAKRNALGTEAKYETAEADADAMHGTIAAEQSAKVTEKEAAIKEKIHKGSIVTQMEKKQKRDAHHYRKKLKNLQMHLTIAKHAAAEATEKLRVASKVEELSEKDQSLKKSTEKIDEQIHADQSAGQASAAIQELESARTAAYKAQRKAAMVAHEIANAKEEPRGAIMKQGHADMDANKLRHMYDIVKAGTSEAIATMPDAQGAAADIFTIEKDEENAKLKAKATVNKAKKEKELCEKLEKESEAACSGGSSKTGSSEVALGASVMESQNAAAAGTKNATAGAKEGKHGKDKGTQKGKSGKEKGISKVCKNAQKKADKVCKRVKKAENAAESDAEQALQREAYTAQMKAAEVAHQEAAGEASMVAVKRADAAAQEAARRASEPVKLDLDGAKKEGKMFSASQVKKMVAAEVKKSLDAQKLLKKDNATITAAAAKGKKEEKKDIEAEKELDAEVDKDVTMEVNHTLANKKKDAMEKGQKVAKQAAKERNIKKKMASNEGKVKDKAKRHIKKVTKKGAKLLKKAFNAQLRVAQLAKMRHDGSATGEQVADGDDAALKAKKASGEYNEIVAEAIQCHAGKGKLFKMEKQLTSVDSKSPMRGMIEGQIEKLAMAVGIACKQEHKARKKAATLEQQASKATSRAKADLAKAENAESKNNATAANATNTTAPDGGGASGKVDFEVIVEHGAITARIKEPEGAKGLSPVVAAMVQDADSSAAESGTPEIRNASMRAALSSEYQW